MTIVSQLGASDPNLTESIIGMIPEPSRPKVGHSKSLSVELQIEVSTTPVDSSIRGTSFASLGVMSRASVKAETKRTTPGVLIFLLAIEFAASISLPGTSDVYG